ncbi:MAG: 8-amino-7-oxononanoate synthase [Firmicutes bacterium]|nr:8-amino-7-oxononanoate synthase [Bacillota bacterium]
MPNTHLPAPWRERLELENLKRHRIGRERVIVPPSGLDFCSNDYLGLRRDPRLTDAACEAARIWGAGAGSARLLRGDCPLHGDLETTLATWKGTETALLFSSGYQCNISVLPTLIREGDAIFSDALNHASIVDGCRMAKHRGARVCVYAHNDLQDLDQRMRWWRRNSPSHALALVVTDAVFSMDGDTADLSGLLDLCERHHALLMVDEAHATGLLGKTGAGWVEQQGLKGRIPLLMGTLGKALGSFGAYLACSHLLREELVNACRGFIYTTSLPPPTLAAALEGARIAQTELWRRDRALAHAVRLREALGLSPQPSAIVPVPAGPDERAMHAAQKLQLKGLDVRAIRPPTVPEGTSRFRITTHALLEDADLDKLIDALQPLVRP